MEVNQQSPHSEGPLMRDYYAKFRKRTYILVTGVQCAVVLLVIGLMELTGITHLGLLWLFVAAFVGAAILNTATIALIHVIGKPFHDLVQAVVLVAGEPTAVAPPNPNIDRYEKDGFKQILQTVYELSAHGQSATPVSQLSDTILQSGMETSRIGFVILDRDRRIVYSNRAAPVHQEEGGPTTLDIVFPEDDILGEWIDKVSTGKLRAEHTWTRLGNKLPGEKDRHLYDVIANFQKNSPAETVLTFIDRTVSYMPEEDDLDFISFAAHELRGPITVIRGYLDVLQDELRPTLENDQAELLQRLVVTSNRLTSYVNNILNASRYDRRHMKLHLSEESVGEIYKTVADDMQQRASAQNRLLVVDIPDTLPTVAADMASIGEVFGNLIDNAIKYSNEGGLVQVTTVPIPGFVEVSIIDHGIGMPMSVLPNLFHKFYRSHRSRETVAGTGIGLYICKAIVSSHGGSIDVRSVENEGSTFSFTLPIYDTVADKIKANDNSNLSLIEHGGGWIKNHSRVRS